MVHHSTLAAVCMHKGAANRWRHSAAQVSQAPVTPPQRGNRRRGAAPWHPPFSGTNRRGAVSSMRDLARREDLPSVHRRLEGQEGRRRVLRGARRLARQLLLAVRLPCRACASNVGKMCFARSPLVPASPPLLCFSSSFSALHCPHAYVFLRATSRIRMPRCMPELRLCGLSARTGAVRPTDSS